MIQLKEISLIDVVNFSEKEHRESDFDRIYSDILNYCDKREEEHRNMILKLHNNPNPELEAKARVIINEIDGLRCNIDKIARNGSKSLYQSKRLSELMEKLMLLDLVPSMVHVDKMEVKIVQLTEPEPLRCDSCDSVVNKLIEHHATKERFCQRCYHDIVEGRPVPMEVVNSIKEFYELNPDKAVLFGRQEWFEWTNDWRRLSWIIGRDWDIHGLRCIAYDGVNVIVAPK